MDLSDLSFQAEVIQDGFGNYAEGEILVWTTLDYQLWQTDSGTYKYSAFLIENDELVFGL